MPSPIRRVIEALDTPPTRGLLAKAFTFAGRSGLRVFHDGEMWMFEHGGDALPRGFKFDFYKWDLENLPARIDQWREETADCWFYRYKPAAGDTIVDVGAEIGTDALFFSQAVGPTGKVVAIEAAPATYQKLLATIRNNRLTNVVPIDKGVADKQGTMCISNDQSIESNFLGDEGDEVEVDTLDAMLADVGEIALLKMNIEGAERLAIQAMDAVIARTRHVAIACHDFEADKTGNEWFRTRQLVEDYLKAKGFKVERRSEDPRPYARDHLHAWR
jgi:FkbM family methyltransferase